MDPSLEVQWTGKDGDAVQKGTRFGTVKGSARSLLVAERIALNLMQRMSGVATATAAMVAAVKVCRWSFQNCNHQFICSKADITLCRDHLSRSSIILRHVYLSDISMS